LACTLEAGLVLKVAVNQHHTILRETLQQTASVGTSSVAVVPDESDDRMILLSQRADKMAAETTRCANQQNSL
jgi:hypothetical protein